MRSLYESILDDEEDLIQNLDNTQIKKFYLEKIIFARYGEDEKYGPFVTFKNKNTQLHYFNGITTWEPFPTFVDEFYTDVLNVKLKEVYESNFKNKQVKLDGYGTEYHPVLRFIMTNNPILENVNVKSNEGLREIKFDFDFKYFKNCKFEMGCDDARYDAFKINVGMSKINDWKTFKELTIINKSQNNKYNPLTLKVGDTPLANKFFKVVKRFKPASQSKADYEEIQKTAMDYFYKEIEPNIKHIPGLAAVHMFVQGGWNKGYSTLHSKWRGFVKNLETGEWTYVDKFNPYKENEFKF